MIANSSTSTDIQWGVRYLETGRVVIAADENAARSGLIAPPAPVELVHRALPEWRTGPPGVSKVSYRQRLRDYDGAIEETWVELDVNDQGLVSIDVGLLDQLLSDAGYSRLERE